jgi:hypothetical protein
VRRALVALLLVSSCDEVTCVGTHTRHVDVTGYDRERVHIQIDQPDVPPQLIQVPVFIPMPFHVKASPAITAEKQ